MPSVNYAHYDDEGYLVIKARLPAEQGAAVLKAIEAARDILWNERKSIAAETLSGNIFESQAKPEDEEPCAAERADALCLMAEAFQALAVQTVTRFHQSNIDSKSLPPATSRKGTASTPGAMENRLLPG